MKRCLMLVLAIPLVAASPALAETTRAEYIAQASPVCTDALNAQNSALQGFIPDVKRGEFKRAAGKFRRLGPVLTGLADRLAGLEPPAADSALIGAWLQALRAEVPIINNYATALAGGSIERLRRVTSQIVTASSFQRA